MTRKRRYLISASVLVACVCIALGVLAMLPSQPGVTKADFDRIEKGMLSHEVELILGKPMQPHMRDLDRHDMDTWRASDGSWIRIDYFRDTVTKKRWVDSSFTDKLRRWLHLPE
jgi:hypothetical protein